MKQGLETLYCPLCGGTNVQVKAWVDANTNKYRSDVNTPLENEDTWCEFCEEHTGLLTLKELWDKFSDVPVNNDDEIEEGFMCFEAGTPKFDVWHWFDERCPKNLHDDLLYPKEDVQQPILNANEIALKRIKSEYHSGDVCMYDLLASLPADGLSIEEAFEVYIEAKKWADGDEPIELK